MIKITKLHPAIAEKFFGKIGEQLTFLETGPYLVDLYLQQLLANLRERPDGVMVLVAMQNDTELVGFIVAHNTAVEHVHISQLWSKPGNPWSVAREMISRISLWAVGLGKTALRGESFRDGEAMFRGGGFVEISKTMELKLDSSKLVSEYMSLLRKG